MGGSERYQVKRSTRGPRNAHLVREIGDGPRMGSAATQQSEAFGHDGIARSRQPPHLLFGQAGNERRKVSTNRASESLASMASLPTRPEPASSTRCRMEFSSQCPEPSVRMLTLKTAGSPLSIGRQRKGPQVMYPQTNPEIAPPPPAS